MISKSLSVSRAFHGIKWAFRLLGCQGEGSAINPGVIKMEDWKQILYGEGLANS